MSTNYAGVITLAHEKQSQECSTAALFGSIAIALCNS